MVNKYSFLILIFNSFLFYKIFSKTNSKLNICLNDANIIFEKILMNEPPSKKEEKQAKDELKYYCKDKNINVTRSGLKLNLIFTGISQYKSQSPSSDFKVIYNISFYDKEKLGIDVIKAKIEDEEPLYKYSIVKIGDETKGDIDWEVDINGTDNKYQIVQLIGEASFEDIKEIYVYNSFIFKFTKKVKKDRTFEFWLILICFVVIVIITYIGMFVYIYATMSFGRNTLMEANISGSGLINSVSSQDRDSKQQTYRTTA